MAPFQRLFGLWLALSEHLQWRFARALVFRSLEWTCCKVLSLALTALRSSEHLAVRRNIVRFGTVVVESSSVAKPFKFDISASNGTILLKLGQ